MALPFELQLIINRHIHTIIYLSLFLQRQRRHRTPFTRIGPTGPNVQKHVERDYKCEFGTVPDIVLISLNMKSLKKERATLVHVHFGTNGLDGGAVAQLVAVVNKGNHDSASTVHRVTKAVPELQTTFEIVSQHFHHAQNVNLFECSVLKRKLIKLIRFDIYITRPLENLLIVLSYE